MEVIEVHQRDRIFNFYGIFEEAVKMNLTPFFILFLRKMRNRKNFLCCNKNFFNLKLENICPRHRGKQKKNFFFFLDGQKVC